MALWLVAANSKWGNVSSVLTANQPVLGLTPVRASQALPQSMGVVSVGAGLPGWGGVASAGYHPPTHPSATSEYIIWRTDFFFSIKWFTVCVNAC